MANNEWTDKAADEAARAAQRRETGGASVPAGGVHAPADASIPGAPEHEGRTPGREAATGVNAPPRPEAEPQVPGRRGDEPDLSPTRGASTEEAPDRSDYPILYGEDPGDIGQ